MSMGGYILKDLLVNHKIDLDIDLRSTDYFDITALSRGGIVSQTGPSSLENRHYLNLFFHFPHLLEDGAPLPLAQPHAADAGLLQVLHNGNF